MTKTTLWILSFGLIGAIALGLRTILLTPGSTVNKQETSSFITQSAHQSAPSGTYVPFDHRYGLQGRQRSAGKSETIQN